MPGRSLREKTGLLIDACFSASKIRWILDNVDGARARAQSGQLAFGTVVTWLIWKLTGGAEHVTDVSNASRTMLFNIHTLGWDRNCCSCSTSPHRCCRACGRRVGSSGLTSTSLGLGQVPIAGVAGDQQAALFGQMCSEPGMSKNTYGTGCFLLQNIGGEPTTSKHNLVTTVAWQMDGLAQYALEGSVFIGGAVVQWLRDGLGLIRTAADVVKPSRTRSLTMAASTSCRRSPASAPRTGIVRTRRNGWPHAPGTNAGHIARSSVRYIALPGGRSARCDGGGLRNSRHRTSRRRRRADNNCVDADAGRPAQRAVDASSGPRTTALRAAYLAGLGVHMQIRNDITSQWQVDRRFRPPECRAQAQAFAPLVTCGESRKSVGIGIPGGGIGVLNPQADSFSAQENDESTSFSMAMVAGLAAARRWRPIWRRWATRPLTSAAGRPTAKTCKLPDRQKGNRRSSWRGSRKRFTQAAPSSASRSRNTAIDPKHDATYFMASVDPLDGAQGNKAFAETHKADFPLLRAIRPKETARRRTACSPTAALRTAGRSTSAKTAAFRPSTRTLRRDRQRRRKTWRQLGELKTPLKMAKSSSQQGPGANASGPPCVRYAGDGSPATTSDSSCGIARAPPHQSPPSTPRIRRSPRRFPAPHKREHQHAAQAGESRQQHRRHHEHDPSHRDDVGIVGIPAHTREGKEANAVRHTSEAHESGNCRRREGMTNGSASSKGIPMMVITEHDGGDDKKGDERGSGTQKPFGAGFHGFGPRRCYRRGPCNRGRARRRAQQRGRARQCE